VLSDAILAYHESEAMLKELNDHLMGLYDDHEIEFARVFARTSNVFSTGLEFWVRDEPEQVVVARLILQAVKQKVDYDDALYSTGIIMPREQLHQLRALLGGRYPLESDQQLMDLVQQKGEELVDEIQEAWPDSDAEQEGST